MMQFFSKHFIPLNWRVRIKWLGYAMLDIVSPVKGERVPARRETFIGGGNFEAAGDDFLTRLKKHGLNPDMTILDVGCGQGRMARPLVAFLSEKGQYTGFDIVKSGIEWCVSEYKGLPQFTFLHSDVFNSRYNVKGQVLAKDYVFPFPDEQFDFTFLTSVFTHMLKHDVDNYIGQIARTLKPEAKLLATWFLWPTAPQDGFSPSLDFRFDIDEVSKTTVKTYPEAAIAFDEAFVLALYAKHGLEVTGVEHGTWARSESPFYYQDVIVAVKTACVESSTV